MRNLFLVVFGLGCFALGALYQDGQAMPVDWERYADLTSYATMIKADLAAGRPIIDFDQYLINVAEEDGRE